MKMRINNGLKIGVGPTETFGLNKFDASGTNRVLLRVGDADIAPSGTIC